MTRLALAALILAAILTAGCGSYWTDAGQAARLRAQADSEAAQTVAIAEAEAARIIAEAEADATRIDAQADANTQDAAAAAIRANAYTPTLIALLSAIMIAALVAAMIAVLYFRSPAPDPLPTMPPPSPWHIVGDPVLIETPEGPVLIPPVPGESRRRFLLRARAVSDLLGGGRFLPPPR